MSSSATERLLKLKDEIAQAKIDKAQIEGALKQNLQRLKDEFQCRSIEQAKTKLAKLKEQKETLQEQIEKAVENLEGNYSW